MSTCNKVKLVSSDNQVFEVDELVAFESQTLKVMIVEAYELSPLSLKTDRSIPLPNVSGKILSKVIEYCEYHLEAQILFDEEKPIKIKRGHKNIHQTKLNKTREWDANFIIVDQYTLYYLMEAANYLVINPLIDLTCGALADVIRSLSPKEMRTLFNIHNDLTPKEEEEIKKDIPFAFD